MRFKWTHKSQCNYIHLSDWEKFSNIRWAVPFTGSTGTSDPALEVNRGEFGLVLVLSRRRSTPRATFVGPRKAQRLRVSFVMRSQTWWVSKLLGFSQCPYFLTLVSKGLDLGVLYSGGSTTKADIKRKGFLSYRLLVCTWPAVIHRLHEGGEQLQRGRF